MDNESSEFVGGDEETGEGRSESAVERLVRGEKQEVDYRDKMKDNEKIDQLFVEMMMKVDERG